MNFCRSTIKINFNFLWKGSTISNNIKFDLIWATDQSELANVDISYIATDADFLAVEYYMDGFARGGMSLISLDDYTGQFTLTYFGSDTGDFATGSPMMWARQLTGITRTGMHIGPTYGVYIRNSNTLTGFNYHVKPGKIYAAKIIN